MTAPVDIFNELVRKFENAFDAACPPIPICKARVDETLERLRVTHDSGDEDGIYLLAAHARDIGLSIAVSVTPLQEKKK